MTRRVSVRRRALEFADAGRVNGVDAVVCGGFAFVADGCASEIEDALCAEALRAMHATRKAFARRVVRELREYASEMRRANYAQDANGFYALGYEAAARMVEEMAGIRSKEKRRG